MRTMAPTDRSWWAATARFAGGQDGVLVLAHRVGGQAPVLFGQAHGAPGGMEAHAHLLGRRRSPRPGGRRPRRGGRTDGRSSSCTRPEPVRPGRRRWKDRPLPRPGAPSTGRGPQPVEQPGPHGGGERAGQVLVDVMVGVDQAGRHHAAIGPERAHGRRLGAGRADADHQAAVDGHPSPRHFPGALRGGEVHGHQHLGPATTRSTSRSTGRSGGWPPGAAARGPGRASGREPGTPRQYPPAHSSYEPPSA